MSLVMVEGQLAWNEFWDDHFLYSKKKDGINSWILGFNSLKISQTVHVKNTHAPFYCSKQNAQRREKKEWDMIVTLLGHRFMVLSL